MGGREFRATLLFLLMSLVVGTGYREWHARASGGADGPTFIERLRAMDEADRLESERGRDAEELARGADRTAGGEDLTAGEMAGDDDFAPPTATAGRRAPRAKTAPRDQGPPLGSIDVDRASAGDWERLPGIGPALASRIVADRAQRGPFRSPEGLLRVRGIGPKTLSRLRPFLRSAPADSVSLFAK